MVTEIFPQYFKYWPTTLVFSFVRNLSISKPVIQLRVGKFSFPTFRLLEGRLIDQIRYAVPHAM